MKQTFIAYLIDKNGNMTSFERFACKRPETVKKHMLQLMKNDLYRVCNKKAIKIEIYATPDGYNKETTPAATLTL